MDTFKANIVIIVFAAILVLVPTAFCIGLSIKNSNRMQEMDDIIDAQYKGYAGKDCTKWAGFYDTRKDDKVVCTLYYDDENKEITCFRKKEHCVEK